MSVHPPLNKKPETNEQELDSPFPGAALKGLHCLTHIPLRIPKYSEERNLDSAPGKTDKIIVLI
jgi:hypothetical protein